MGDQAGTFQKARFQKTINVPIACVIVASVIAADLSPKGVNIYTNGGFKGICDQVYSP